MASRFDGKIGAFAYLLFILLYFPCVATIGAISREAGFAWAMFVGAWTTGVAYTVSTVFYQSATWVRHPLSSSAWILGLLFISSLIFLLMRRWAQRESDPAPGLST
jgi:ferrous iron transport protein B